MSNPENFELLLKRHLKKLNPRTIMMPYIFILKLNVISQDIDYHSYPFIYQNKSVRIRIRIKILMNKSTNNFRKCDYCPHQDNKKNCCCQVQNRKSFQTVKTKSHSRIHSKNRKRNPNIDQSAISYINTTLPITNNSMLPHFSSNILAENSILRTENDYLKRQLHTHSYHVSAFNKDDRNISTMVTSQNDTSRTLQLHDKLYNSNRNLQEALIELDSLSKSNKQLNELNTKIESQKQQLRIQNEELYEECQRLRKKIKKLNKIMQNLPNQLDVQKILELNSKIENQNASLREEVGQLRSQLKKKQSRNKNQAQNLSPEWVAHTSTKINNLEKNIMRLQEQSKQNVGFMSNYQLNPSTIHKQKLRISQQQDTTLVKQQIIATIKFLKFQSQSFGFNSSSFEQIITNPNLSILALVKNLCESISQPMQLMMYQHQKDLDRLLKMYQSKFQKVVQRIQNMVIKVHNQRLRARVQNKQTI